ncbi:iron-containing alcohol dehydrogenase [Pontiellaceae bacterium B12227]|nr:iron-containing alcohol dehydrogenase [Pontiellaceae bacterium B12227]
MTFEFATAQRIIFGPGKLAELPNLIQGMGKKAALVTGTSAERIGPVFNMLKACGVEPAAFSIKGEPTVERISKLSAGARELGCDFVIAFGGGSIIDAGKAMAALLTNTDDVMNYLEVIGQGNPLTEDPAPCIAIPTTAGTGSEVTRNAVLKCEENQVKVSMRHPKMLPSIALVDPELTLTMSPEVTASTGLDAFVQLLEAFISHKANALTDGICREGLKRVSRSLYRAYLHPEDINARTDMAFASLCGGLALANAGLGAVHGFAGPIGGMFKAPHGMVCASLLPATARINYQALIERDSRNPGLEKFKEASRIILNNPSATIDDALERLAGICMQMFVPGLSEFGITEDDFPAIIEKARNASSMKGNPTELTDRELRIILEDSLHPPVDGDATLYL